ncbi:MAG: crossover junction endodeoxyribonuclease RuvC, partial [Patescibacteria group bacterium]
MSSRVMAIDPGFDRVGVAILDEKGVLFSCCIETNRKLPHEERLLMIGKELRRIVKKWRPQDLAIESLFFNQNTTNAMKVSEARGV